MNLCVRFLILFPLKFCGLLPLTSLSDNYTTIVNPLPIKTGNAIRRHAGKYLWFLSSFENILDAILPKLLQLCQ